MLKSIHQKRRLNEITAILSHRDMILGETVHIYLIILSAKPLNLYLDCWSY